jgi:hypothetical protein
MPIKLTPITPHDPSLVRLRMADHLGAERDKRVHRYEQSVLSVSLSQERSRSGRDDTFVSLTV